MVESSFDSKSYGYTSKSQCEVTKLFDDDDLCGLPDPKSEKNNISKFTTASMKPPAFENDICFVYDPETDHFSAQDLMDKIIENHKQEGKDLKTVNFAEELPVGRPKKSFFIECLAKCHYTCILVSRSFLNNMWNSFGTDMAIQDMLQNEKKRYTVIVIAVDDMKLTDLPLDLQTLSPILRSERYFESRLRKAFAPPFSHVKSSKRSRPKRVSCSPCIPSQSPCTPSTSGSTMPYKSSNIRQPVQESRTVMPSTTPSGATSDFTCVPQSFNPACDFRSASTITPWRQENSPSGLDRIALAKEEQMKIYDRQGSFPRSSDGNSTPAAKMQHHPLSSPQLQISDSTLTSNSTLATKNVTKRHDPPFVKKMQPKSGSSSDMFQQSRNISNFTTSTFPTSTRMPQEHSDTSAFTEMLSSVSSLDYHRQASIFAPSTGLRNPVESDDKERDLKEIAGSTLATLDMKEELFLTDSSDTSRKEIVADSFSQPSPSIKKKVTNERLKEQNDWEIVTDAPKTTEASTSRYASIVSRGSGSIKPSTSRLKYCEEVTNSLQDIEVEISDEELPSDRSFSLRSVYQSIKNKFKKSEPE